MHALPDTDGINEAIRGNFGHPFSEVGCDLVRSGQVTVTVEGLIQVYCEEVGVNSASVGRVQ
jgi:hypothetical protein